MEKGKNSSHDLVIECLSDALIILMKKKPLSKIKISELCEKAGVSRISYYRNYSSFEDILIDYLNTKTKTWWEKYTKDGLYNVSANFWNELSSLYLENKEFIELLYKNNLSSIVKKHIFSVCGPREGFSKSEEYASSVIAGALFGYLDRWFTNGMEKPPFKLSVKVALELYNLMLKNSNS